MPPPMVAITSLMFPTTRFTGIIMQSFLVRLLTYQAVLRPACGLGRIARCHFVPGWRRELCQPQ